MSNLSFVNEQLLNEIVNITNRDLNTTDINNEIYNKLIEKIENKCYNNGFIIKDSIELVNKTLGKIININSNNYISYNVRFKAKLIQPGIDDIIDCYIDNINKMGFISYIKFKDILGNYEDNNSLKDSPLIIIIPLQTIENPENYNVGQRISIKTNAIRLKFNANKIQIVGTINE